MEVFFDAVESHEHPDPLIDSSEIQSDCKLPVSKAPPTPFQVSVIFCSITAVIMILAWGKVYFL